VTIGPDVEAASAKNPASG
jgi:hypothetical protein